MKDRRKVHRAAMVWVPDVLTPCGRAGIYFRWSFRWSDVTCKNCLKHKPKKGKASR